MSATPFFEVGGYRLAEDRFYDPETHLWVAATADGLARVGFDPLGSETSGDVVAISFEPVGVAVSRGGGFGSIEAAKFVGPLTAPLSGTLRAHNEAVLADPGRIQRAPLEAWLVEIAPSAFAAETARMVSGRARIADWFAGEVERFRKKGMLAE